jgi:hypothetical protein
MVGVVEMEACCQILFVLLSPMNVKTMAYDGMIQVKSSRYSYLGIVLVIIISLNHYSVEVVHGISHLLQTSSLPPSSGRS